MKKYRLRTAIGVLLTIIITVTGCQQSSQEKDRELPSVPLITGAEPGKTYNHPVTVYVEEETGVTYEARINDDIYSLGTAFPKEGNHLLEVTAIKKRNQLTSSVQLAFSIDNSLHTNEELAYFLEIALGSEYGGDPGRIKKWVQDLRIEVLGNPGEQDLQCLKGVMSELQELTQGVKLYFDNENPNVSIYFIPHAEFKNHAPEEIAEGNWGLFWQYEGTRGEINGAKILVEIDQGNQSSRNHLIREELTQAMGLGNDSWQYPDSIFYQGWSTTDHFTEIDKKLITLLYDKEIEPNTELTALEAYLKTLALAHQNERVQVFPVNEGLQDPEFFRFRQELLRRVRERDIDFLLKNIDPDYQQEDQGKKGIEAFKEHWIYEGNQEESYVWKLLEKVIPQGGTFINDRLTAFEAPYIYTRLPETYHSHEYLVALGKNIKVHEGPNQASPVIGTLYYDAVRQLSPEENLSPNEGSPADESIYWSYIETQQGLRGYVKETVLYPALGNRILFEKIHGEWKIKHISN